MGYIEDGKLCCTAVLRMQNASIFPKNIHFFATLLHHVAGELKVPVGEYTHIIANLCHDRSAELLRLQHFLASISFPWKCVDALASNFCCAGGAAGIAVQFGLVTFSR